MSTFVLFLLTLLSVTVATPVLDQTQDPCIATDRQYDLGSGQIPLVEEVLEGRLYEHFYRFTNLKPGEMLTVTAVVTTNTSTSVNLLVMREIKPNEFTRVDGKQIIQSGGPSEHPFKWMHANLGDNKPTSICFKVGIFSEARPAKATYQLQVQIDRFLDTGNVEAADSRDKAVQLGKLEQDQSKTVGGYLSSLREGIDHGDMYMISTSLGKGKLLKITLTTQEDNDYQITLYDQTGYGLRNNRTNRMGTATILLTSEDSAEKPFYIRVSNQGGEGGGGRYAVILELIQTQPATTRVTTTATTPTIIETPLSPAISRETALTIVYGSVIAVAATAVAATVLTRRRKRMVVSDQEW
ncbi:MAG: hypothetical protein QXG52_09035 [Candidatus Caldarchaeum sp.]